MGCVRFRFYYLEQGMAPPGFTWPSLEFRMVCTFLNGGGGEGGTKED